MMHRSPRSRRGRLATFAVSAVLITTSPLLLSGVASAAPAPVPVAAPLPPTTSLAANDVGLPSSLTLSAPGASQSLLLPVPDGLTLGSLTGVASVPVSSDAGALEFSSNNVVLGIVNLPASAPGVPSVPFSIPLSAATVVNGNATVTVTFRAAESQLTYFCGATQPVVVSLTSVGYTGTPRPSTSITTFLPPVLQTLDLYIPAEPRGPLGADLGPGVDDLLERLLVEPVAFDRARRDDVGGARLAGHQAHLAEHARGIERRDHALR